MDLRTHSINKQLNGGIDTDTALLDVDIHDYLNAKNLTNRGDVNEQGDLQPLHGSDSFFSLNSVDVQYKTQVLATEQDVSLVAALVNFELKIYNQNGYIVISPSYPAPFANIAALAALIDASIIAAGFTGGCVSSSSNGVYYLDIQLGAEALYDDWYCTGEWDTPGYSDIATITKLEAINVNLSGKPYVIAEKNATDDLFLWATPIRKNTFDYLQSVGGLSANISSITNTVNVAVQSNTRIVFTIPHELVTGNEVKFFGFTTASGSTHLNGIWNVSVVNPTTIDIVMSRQTVYDPYLGVDVNAIMYYYIAGYGLIYHTKRNIGNGLFQNPPNRLIGARKLNFCTLNQIDCYVKVNNYNTVFGFTDYRNKPRLMIYKGSYAVTDGFMAAPVSSGTYFYDTLDSEIQLIVADSKLKITGVTQNTSGGLTSRSYVYYVRGVFDDFTKTTWSAPSGTCIVSKINTNNNTTENELQFQGDIDGTATDKANFITVSNIETGVYKYIELAFVVYDNDSVDGHILKRVPLLETNSTITISHLANTDFIGALDLTSLNQTYVQIEKALNMVEIDNCTVLSNCVLSVDEDLDTWAQAIEYAVKRGYTQNPGTYANAIATVGGMTFGGYQTFNNVYNFPSYMLFETSRIGVQLKRRGGSWTKTYWVDDIIVDNSAIAGRRIGTLADLSLWNAAGVFGSSYYFYLDFSNIDLDYLTVTGRTIREDYEDARFVQVEVRKEVMASGISVLGYDPAAANIVYPFRYPAAIPVGTVDRKTIFFWSPDTTRLDGDNLSFAAGDTLITLGSPALIASTTVTGTIHEFNGSATVKANHAINDIINIATGGQTTSLINTFNLLDPTGGAPFLYWQNAYGIETNTNVVNVGPNPDLGVYLTYIFRPDTVGYPSNKGESIYLPIPIQTSFDFDTHTAATVISVYGGDSFTGRTFLGMNSFFGTQGRSFGFYSQMRNNVYFRHNSFPGYFYDATTSNTMALVGDFYTSWVALQTLKLETDVATLSNAYKYRNEVNSIAAFDSNITTVDDSLAIVYWSLPAPEDSLLNSRVFLSSNKKAIELLYGSIVQMLVIRDRLITIQQDKIEAQYFDNTGKLVSDTTDVLLGTGAVMGRKGDYVTGYGTNSKWGCFLGKSDGGKDVMYLIDTIRRRITRFGLDGTVDFTDEKKISRFLQKGLQFSNWFFTPADGKGTHGGWDDKNKWAYFTVMAYNPTLRAWGDGTVYGAGQVVSYQSVSLLNYGDLYESVTGVPLFWICIGNHTADPTNSPIASGQYWRLISLSDTDFYNWYTFVFSELENRFKWFITPVSKIWIEYQNTILAPSDLEGKQNDIYEYNELGETARWYCYSESTAYTIEYTEGSLIVECSVNWINIIPNYYRFGDNARLYILVGGEYIEATIDDSHGNTAFATLRSAATSTAVADTLQYRVCVSEDANIKCVINEIKGNNTKFVALKYEIESAPTRVDMVTNRTETHLEGADFENFDEFYFSPIKNDETMGTLNTDDTSQIYGKYMTLDTIIKNGDINLINNFAVKVRKIKGG